MNAKRQNPIKAIDFYRASDRDRPQQGNLGNASNGLPEVMISDKPMDTTMQESLRSIRTNLTFCGDDVRVVLITSNIPGEGKTTVSYHLARSLNEIGKSVILLDADMRKSRLAKRLEAVTNDGGIILGLMHVLSGQISAADDQINIFQHAHFIMIMD